MLASAMSRALVCQPVASTSLPTSHPARTPTSSTPWHKVATAEGPGSEDLMGPHTLPGQPSSPGGWGGMVRIAELAGSQDQPYQPLSQNLSIIPRDLDQSRKCFRPQALFPQPGHPEGWFLPPLLLQTPKHPGPFSSITIEPKLVAPSLPLEPAHLAQLS